MLRKYNRNRAFLGGRLVAHFFEFCHPFLKSVGEKMTSDNGEGKLKGFTNGFQEKMRVVTILVAH